MSTAAVVKEEPQKKQLILVATQPTSTSEQESASDNPWITILIAVAIALFLSSVLMGSVIAGLLLRHSGVMAP